MSVDHLTKSGRFWTGFWTSFFFARLRRACYLLILLVRGAPPGETRWQRAAHQHTSLASMKSSNGRPLIHGLAAGSKSGAARTARRRSSSSVGSSFVAGPKSWSPRSSVSLPWPTHRLNSGETSYASPKRRDTCGTERGRAQGSARGCAKLRRGACLRRVAQNRAEFARACANISAQIFARTLGIARITSSG